MPISFLFADTHLIYYSTLDVTICSICKGRQQWRTQSSFKPLWHWYAWRQGIQQQSSSTMHAVMHQDCAHLPYQRWYTSIDCFVLTFLHDERRVITDVPPAKSEFLFEFATAPNDVAIAGGPNQNSLFTSFLLPELSNGKLFRAYCTGVLTVLIRHWCGNNDGGSTAKNERSTPGSGLLDSFVIDQQGILVDTFVCRLFVIKTIHYT